MFTLYNMYIFFYYKFFEVLLNLLLNNNYNNKQNIYHHIFTYNLDTFIENNYETFDDTFLSSTENIRLTNSNHPRAPTNIYTSTNFNVQPENLIFNPWRPLKKLSNL